MTDNTSQAPLVGPDGGPSDAADDDAIDPGDEITPGAPDHTPAGCARPAM